MLRRARILGKLGLLCAVVLFGAPGYALAADWDGVIEAHSPPVGDGAPDQKSEIVAKQDRDVKPELFKPIKDCAECPNLIPVPSPSDKDRLLYVGQFELTWKEYLHSVRLANCPMPEAIIRSAYPDKLDELADNFPLKYLSPKKFQCYLDWINSKTGKTYRLPKTKEWEHFARAGAKTRYSWGDELGYDNAAVSGHFDRTKIVMNISEYDPRKDRHLGDNSIPVGSFAPNAWNIHDVIGNVSEFVDEEGPAMSKYCLQKLGAENCRSLSVRGGHVYSITIRIGVGLVGEGDDLSTKNLWMPYNYISSAGFRIVRD
jgi:Sulfatase-modifying factor enzyme 1